MNASPRFRSIRRWSLTALLLASACQRQENGPLVLMGTLERDRISLAAPVAERVIERPVQEGEKVSAGTLIARLDDSRLRAERAITVAAVDRAKANLAQLLAGTTREQIAQAEADHAGAKAAAATAQSELRRIEKLFRDKLVPQSELDRARSGAEEAEARKQRTAQFLAEQKRGPRQEEVDMARAQLAEAQAKQQEVEVRLGQLELRAPVDAIIEELPFEVGERPVLGAEVAILVADSTPYARVFVPEASVARIQHQQPARAAVDGAASDLEAQFRYVASEAMFTPYYSLTDRERALLVFQAKVDLTDPRARHLRTGIPVRVTLP